MKNLLLIMLLAVSIPQVSNASASVWHYGIGASVVKHP